MNDDLVKSADQFITEKALQETNCKVFPPGTLIVAMYGEGKTRGKVSELGIAAATNQALAAVQITDPRLERRFAFWVLRANYLTLREQAAGGVQPNLNLKMIGDFRLLLPPSLEQQEIVRRIETAFAWLDKVAAEHARAAHLLPKLDQGILAKAFRGELVPQDPSDEPASALLQRINAERAATNGSDTSGRRRRPGRDRGADRAARGV